MRVGERKLPHFYDSYENPCLKESIERVILALKEYDEEKV